MMYSYFYAVYYVNDFPWSKNEADTANTSSVRTCTTALSCFLVCSAGGGGGITVSMFKNCRSAFCVRIAQRRF